MRRTRSRARTLAATAGAATLLLLVIGSSAPAAASTPRTVPGDGATSVNVAANQPVTSAATAAPVEVALVSTAPIAPPVQASDTTVTVVVSVTNNTDNTLQQLQLRAVRDSPIIRPSALNSMLAHPTTPADPDLTQNLAIVKYSDAVAPHSSVQLTYQFPASSIRETGGVCLCQSGVYPIDLSVYAATTARGNPTGVGWVQTYLVSVASTPAAEQVSSLWPLLDRPHRLSESAPFIDDDLAAEVAPGGRLDRALQVLEQLAPTSQVTVVIDPELIDELQQMATGYRVEQGAATVPGTGGPAAADWLRRLRAAITGLPLALTPYGDPAVNASAAAHLPLSTTMPSAMSARVELALGQTITVADSQLAWPPDETLTPAALTELADSGTSTVVLNDSTLPGGKGASPPLPAVATVSGTDVHALVTSSALEQRVSTLLASGTAPLASLPALLSVLALPTLQAGASPSYLVLTPSRYIDPDPTTAATLISATISSSWASPIEAATAAATIPATDHGSLTGPSAQHYGGAPALLELATTTTAFDTDFASVLDPASSASSALLAGLPMAIQLSQSAGWAQNPDAAAAFGRQLSAQQTQLTDQVQIVRPSNGSYSLASSSSPLLVTVSNNLAVAVTVRVTMTSVGGVVGFRTDDAGLQTIPANSRRTIKLQAHVSRSGHFRVQAQLSTPNGANIGAPLPLSIYSSALGTIGVVITVVAAAVLMLALVVRFVRRWRHHRELIRRMMAQEQLIPAGAHG